MKKNYAVVTGASRGLGKAYAKELANMGYHLLLISLPDEELQVLGSEIASLTGVQVHCFETDLADKEKVLQLGQLLADNHSIDFLVNNAGFGGGRHFLEVSDAYLDRMIQVNVRATVLLTHKLLPKLLEQNQAYVLNVASMAALSPIPYKTVYPSTKAFVHSFTRSMQKEYEHTTVHFAVVNPGPMMTNPDVVKRMEYQGYMVRKSILSPQKVAQVSLKKTMQGKKVVTLTGYHRFQMTLLRIIPESIKMKILGKVAKNEVLSNEHYANIS